MQKYRLLYASFFAGSKLHRMGEAETKVDILVHAFIPSASRLPLTAGGWQLDAYLSQICQGVQTAMPSN